MAILPRRHQWGFLAIPYDQSALTRRKFSPCSFLQNYQIQSNIEQTIDGMLKHIFLSLSGRTETENLPYPSSREELFLIIEKDQDEGEVAGEGEAAGAAEGAAEAE